MAGLGLAGCDHFDVREAAGHLPPYQNAVDRPRTIIDTALEHCPDKTEEAETECVRRIIADRHIDAAALAVLIPGCRGKHICVYHYVTDDRLGYVQAMAADYVVRWRVTFDAERPGPLKADGITVVQE